MEAKKNLENKDFVGNYQWNKKEPNRLIKNSEMENADDEQEKPAMQRKVFRYLAVLGKNWKVPTLSS